MNDIHIPWKMLNQENMFVCFFFLELDGICNDKRFSRICLERALRKTVQKDLRRHIDCTTSMNLTSQNVIKTETTTELQILQQEKAHWRKQKCTFGNYCWFFNLCI